MARKKYSKRFFPLILLFALCLGAFTLSPSLSRFFNREKRSGTATIPDAYRRHLSHLHVTGSGKVVQILPDDDRGIRHQRFILRLPSGRTLLIAHNLDVAPRIPDLQRGDTVAFSGEYEWNAQGGVVHWTHHDPSGRHRGGWLKYHGKTYQ